MKLISSTTMKRDPSLTCYSVMLSRTERLNILVWLDNNKVLYQLTNGFLPGQASIYTVYDIVCTPATFTCLTLASEQL